MNPLFGTSWSEWVLGIVGGVVVLVISAVITRLFHRIEALEVALPKRMEQYLTDQANRQQQLGEKLQEMRHTINEHAVQIGAIRAKMDRK